MNGDEENESAAGPGWYADASGQFEQRWWDGSGWTARVRTGGEEWFDPTFGLFASDVRKQTSHNAAGNVAPAETLSERQKPEPSESFGSEQHAYCASCGRQAYPGSTFCAGCGSELHTPPVTATDYRSAANPPGNRGSPVLRADPADALWFLAAALALGSTWLPWFKTPKAGFFQIFSGSKLPEVTGNAWRMPSTFLWSYKGTHPSDLKLGWVILGLAAAMVIVALVRPQWSEVGLRVLGCGLATVPLAFLYQTFRFTDNISLFGKVSFTDCAALGSYVCVVAAAIAICSAFWRARLPRHEGKNGARSETGSHRRMPRFSKSSLLIGGLGLVVALGLVVVAAVTSEGDSPKRKISGRYRVYSTNYRDASEDDYCDTDDNEASVWQDAKVTIRTKEGTVLASTHLDEGFVVRETGFGHSKAVNWCEFDFEFPRIPASPRYEIVSPDGAVQWTDKELKRSSWWAGLSLDGDR